MLGAARICDWRLHALIDLSTSDWVAGFGVHEGKILQYVGRVGTGLSGKVAEDLFARVERLREPASPFQQQG